MRGAIPSVPLQFDAFALGGGLDQHTPQLALSAGAVRDALNFECAIAGGYTRVAGYERFSGKPSPSGARYVVLDTTCGATPTVGTAVNGQTSGVTATVAARSGSLVIVAKTSGTFVNGENLRDGVTVLGTIVQAGVIVTDRAVAASYKNAAADILRNDIAAVPGSGPVRGVAAFGGFVYAWRDNAGATACVLHRADSTGWLAVNLGHEVSFTGGSGTQPTEGATITKGVVSAVIRRVVTELGSWAAGTASGRFIINAPSGGTFSAGALTAGGTATLSGANSAITFLPGGRFEMKAGNAGNGIRLYGCDKVNRGWEFDGSTLVPIKTGMTADQPRHVHTHKNHLFFSFGPSVQHSGLGAPYVWTPLLGAGELAIDSNVTGFLSLPGDGDGAALGVLEDGAASVLYGNSSADWKLQKATDDGGSKEYGAQSLGLTLLFDDRGIGEMRSTAAYGNFQGSTLTAKMRTFLQQRRTRLTASIINYERNQYRAFFSDGYGLYLTVLNGKVIGGMPVKFAHPVAVACNGESADGSEVSYFGSTDGFVYRMDVGTSFDGQAIPAFFLLAYASQSNAQVRKRYRRALFEIQGDGYAQFSIGYELGFSAGDVEQGRPQDTEAAVAAIYWDSFTWDDFQWDGRAIAPIEMRLEGNSTNIAIRFDSNSDLWPSYTVNSITLQYTPRRIDRK